MAELARGIPTPKFPQCTHLAVWPSYAQFTGVAVVALGQVPKADRRTV